MDFNDPKIKAVFDLWKDLTDTQRTAFDLLAMGYAAGIAEGKCAIAAAPAHAKKAGRPRGSRNKKPVVIATSEQEVLT